MGRLLALILILLLNNTNVKADLTEQALSQHDAIKARLLAIRNQLPSDELKNDIDSELKSLPIPIDIRHSHPALNKKIRAVTMAWLGEPAEEYGLSYHTYFLSVSILDRFIHANALKTKRVEIGRSKIQLAGVSALKIAANVNEEENYVYKKTGPQSTPSSSPNLETLFPVRAPPTSLSLFSNKHCSDLCNKIYTSHHVDRMTRYMMRTLDYRFALTPTIDFWVYHYLGFIGISHHEYREDFIRFFKLSMHALSIAVLDADSRLYAPIELALAAVQLLIPIAHRPIVLAPECLDFMKHYIELSSANPIGPRTYVQGRGLAQDNFAEASEWMWFSYQKIYKQFAEDMKP